MAVEVTGTFDGGNPQAGSSIRRLGDDEFEVRPFSEDGDANYKFALNVAVRNDGRAPVPVRLLVEWEDARYATHRNFVHVGSGDEWRYVPAVVEGTASAVVFRVLPGTTYVGISPEYGLARYERFAADLERRLPAGARRVGGHSREERDIDACQFGTGAKGLFVLTRVHPYETAASYCAEGLLGWLAQQVRCGAGWLSEWQCVVVPMPNPDGVALGLCKRTSLSTANGDGADLERQGTERAHPETVAAMDVIDALRPMGFLDVHGWMHYDEDGIHCSQDGPREAFLRAAEDTGGLRYNRWNGRYATASATGMRHHGREAFGAKALAVSYRWPGRSVDDMRAIGRSTLTAFLAVLEAI